jgi:hypothetical protein
MFGEGAVTAAPPTGNVRGRQHVAERILVAVPCLLSKGIFSSERVFEVTLANGETYQGIAPRHFCWNNSKKPLGETEAQDEEVSGLLAARVVEELDDDQVAVAVPDGKVLAVKKGQIRARPTPINPPRAGHAV